jgi:hypothetical protein
MTDNTRNDTMTLDEMMTKLKEYEKNLKRERKWVDIKPYSDTIISSTLQLIDDLQIEGVCA